MIDEDYLGEETFLPTHIKLPPTNTPQFNKHKGANWIDSPFPSNYKQNHYGYLGNSPIMSQSMWKLHQQQVAIQQQQQGEDYPSLQLALVGAPQEDSEKGPKKEKKRGYK